MLLCYCIHYAPSTEAQISFTVALKTVIKRVFENTLKYNQLKRSYIYTLPVHL